MLKMLSTPYDPPFWSYFQISCRNGPKATKNGATSILMADLNSGTIKTHNDVSLKLNEFDKLT